MNHRRPVKLLYGKEGADLQLPSDAVVLSGKDPPAVADPGQAVASALAEPIGTPPLTELIRRRRPETIAITVSDITRPVPNRQFLPAMLDALAEAGICDEQVSIIIGTGMHRPSTPEERDFILGREILERLQVIDHTADRPETLTKVSADPPVSVCTRFVEADFRIVTGYIEPHFMAGFSGGRKGVFPALVDLASIQRFHGFDVLANPLADNGILDGNPCHEIALELANTVGVDFLLNVAITREREIAGIYCGDLVEAHLAGCRGGRRLDHRRGSRPPRPGGHVRGRVSARSDLLPDCKGHVHRPPRSPTRHDLAPGLGLWRGPGKSSLHRADARVGLRLARLPRAHRGESPRNQARSVGASGAVPRTGPHRQRAPLVRHRWHPGRVAEAPRFDAAAGRGRCDPACPARHRRLSVDSPPRPGRRDSRRPVHDAAQRAASRPPISPV